MIKVSLLAFVFVISANTLCNAQLWIGSAVRRRRKNIEKGKEIVPQLDKENKGIIGVARTTVSGAREGIKNEFKGTTDKDQAAL